MEDKIDIHKIGQKHDRAVEKLKIDETMNKRNKELILKFLWDCKIGKTVEKGSKKKIGKKRMLKYLYSLKTLSRWLG
ncbi:hypothetical protein GTO36_09215, partial [bacterium]|nr:hypothetical protein [bacterium]